jgi:tRNA A-37 threonylcarbamoyl transferase component Bud32
MDQPFTVMTGRISWRVDKAYPSLPERLAEALGHGAPRPLKASRVRKTFLLPPRKGGPPVVLKAYKTGGLDAMARAVFLGTPALREWRTLSLLSDHDVAVPRVVALGSETVLGLPRRSYLAMEALEDVSTLEDILLQKKPCPVPRKMLAPRVGRLVRDLHDAGVLHLDLHAANILVNRSGRPLLIDLHGARRFKSLSKAQRIRDLVSLAGSFLVHGTRTDRLRFFRAYATRLQGLSDLPMAAREVETAAWERLHRFYRKYDFRCLRPGRLFQSLETYNLSGIGERAHDTSRLLTYLGLYPHETLEEKGRRIHQTGTSRIYWIVFEGKSYVVKVYIKPGLQECLHRMAKGSRGRRNWFRYNQLRFRQIPVPRPVLYLEEPFTTTTGRSYVVVEGDVEYITLDRFVLKASRSDLLETLHRLAGCIARMHRFFLSNRDLKAQNILVGPNRDVRLLDPDGVDFMLEPRAYPSVMARDLMRLNASFPHRSRISMADRRRFLRAYSSHMRLSPGEERELWWEILFLTWNKWSAWKRREKRSRRKTKI